MESCSSSGHLYGGFEAGAEAAAGVDINLTGIDNEVHAAVEIAELLFCDAEGELFRFTGRERHLFKSGKLPDRADALRHGIAEETQGNFVACAAAGVLNRNLHVNAVRSCLGGQIRVFIGRVGETVAEGINRCQRRVEILRSKLGSAAGTSRVRMIIVAGAGAGIVREGSRQLGGRIDIAEQDVQDSIAGLHAQMPGFHDGRDVFLQEGDLDR